MRIAFLLLLVIIGNHVVAQDHTSDFAKAREQFYVYNNVLESDSNHYFLAQAKAAVAASQDDSLKAELSVMLSDFKAIKGETDSASYYNKEAIRLFKLVNAPRRILRYTFKQSGIADVNGNRDEAFEWAKEVHRLSLEFRDTFYIIRGLDLLGSYHATRGENILALEHCVAAAEYWDKLSPEDQKLFSPHKLLGLIYTNTNRLDEAIQEWQVVVEWYLEKENYWKACQWSNNLALTYLDNNDTVAAKEVLYRSSAYGLQADFNYGYANAQSQLAAIAVFQNQLDSAKLFLERVHEAVPVIEEPTFAADNNMVTGMYYEALGDYDRAITFIKKAYAHFVKQNMSYESRNCSQLLAEACQQAGRYQEAYQYLSEYTVYQDSVVNRQTIEKFKEVELTADFEKQRLNDSLNVLAQQQQIELAFQQDIAEEREGKNQLIFAVILLIMGVSFAAYAFIRQRRQARLLDEKNAIISKALHEKQLLLKEVHHRVKNNFQIVSSLLELQSKGIEDKKARELAEEGKNRVKSMAFIHQKLYQNDELLIYFDEYVDALVKEIAAMYGGNVKTNIDVDRLAFDIDTAVPLGLIINELVTNAFKYGFEDGGVLDIAIEKEANDYKLTVSDNGKGLPEGIDLSKAKSLGLRLVRQLSRQLQGKVQYKYADGAQFSIWFKDSLGRASVD